MMMRTGLYTRFWLIVLAVMLVCLVLSVVAWRQQVAGIERLAQASGRAIHEAGENSERQRALGVAQLVADAAVNPLYYFDLVALGEITSSTLAQPGIAYVLIYDNDGRIVHDGSRDIVRFGQRMGDDLAGASITAREPLLQMDDGLVDATVPVWLGKERIGGVRVGISLVAPLAFERDAVTAIEAQGLRLQRHLARLGLLLLGCILVLTLVLGWWLSRYLVAPIRRLANAAQRIEQGDFATDQIPARRSDELSTLEQAFVHMAQSLRQRDQAIRRLAFDDGLTGLPNRTSFRQVLDARIKQIDQDGGQLALLFIDLDEFKRINDTLGHDIGDEAIVEFASRIRRVAETQAQNSIELARFGGDEFVAILAGEKAHERSAHLAKALLAELRQPVTLGGRSIALAASIGISLYPQDASHAAGLLKKADIAMYRAKLDGKNCHRFYTRDMEGAVVLQMRLEQDLRLALERNELVVYYQPIHSIQSRQVVGAEALVRWNHPEYGLMEPERFIPVAEQSGQIEAIGQFVLQTACEDATHWPEAIENGYVSVNVSVRQLQRTDLPVVVADALNRSGLPAARLHLEFTESAVLDNEAEAISAATRLRQAGVRIWLDDFGTGFSGLSQLRRVPVDGVKIDRSFIADILDDPGDLALTTAIIAMAHSLGIVVTAEGVENEGQYAILKTRGCDNIQGFWLDRAIPNDEFMARWGQR